MATLAGTLIGDPPALTPILISAGVRGVPLVKVTALPEHTVSPTHGGWVRTGLEFGPREQHSGGLLFEATAGLDVVPIGGPGIQHTEHENAQGLSPKRSQPGDAPWCQSLGSPLCFLAATR